MAAHPTLTSIPTDIQHLLLTMLPDFDDLGAMILTHRAFHEIYKARQNSLLHDVARNFLGCLFDEALLLARRQEAKYTALGGGEAVAEGLSTNIITFIINNDYVVDALEQSRPDAIPVSFSVFLRWVPLEPRVDSIYDAESLGRFADDPFTIQALPTESSHAALEELDAGIPVALTNLGQLAHVRRDGHGGQSACTRGGGAEHERASKKTDQMVLLVLLVSCSTRIQDPRTYKRRSDNSRSPLGALGNNSAI
ncbi:hypothetical protein B0H16DRAFT_1462575 [Mycena metata]|uniref:F-box domain-containing protein n=1 Tax=Mycena metata TaxID=1033252 RepID=A0AAD7IP79_9AGAR|nr:hypothetical protein B0H16DRAFT_1462575 [Mycena metata]